MSARFPAFSFTDPTGQILPFSDATTTYQNSTYGFSLLFPAELAVDEYDEGDGDRTLVLRKGATDVGFQIFITSYDGTLSLSDLQRVAPATVGTSTRAHAFESTAPGVGPSRELWFVHKGHLFQVTTIQGSKTG